MDVVAWIIAGASIIGTWLNVKKNRVCFWIWLFTNGFWCIYDLAIGAYAQASIFAVYFALSIKGLIEWRASK